MLGAQTLLLKVANEFELAQTLNTDCLGQRIRLIYLRFIKKKYLSTKCTTKQKKILFHDFYFLFLAKRKYKLPLCSIDTPL